MRKLNDWLESYIKYTSMNEAPGHFHFWAGVGVIAAALRRKVWMDMKYFQWTPNFYIIFVAPPGLAVKSTVLAIGKNLLTELQTIRFGPAALTWQSLVKNLSECLEHVPMPDGSFLPMSCLTFFASELGTLVDPRDRQMINVLVDLWDGQTGIWEKTTKTQGDDRISSPWLNILAGTTPAWLQDNVPKTMIGGGFTARCVFVVGKCKSQLVPYPKLVVDPGWWQDLHDKLLHDLEVISTLRGEAILTPEAYQLGADWYGDHYKKSFSSLQAEDLGGYFARKQTHVHKLAMVLSAARSDALVIEKTDLEKAIAITTAVEEDLPQVFRALTTTELADRTAKLVQVILARKAIEKSELYRMFFHAFENYTQYCAAIQAAVSAGYIMEVVRGPKIILVATPPSTAPGTSGTGSGSASGPASPSASTSGSAPGS